MAGLARLGELSEDDYNEIAGALLATAKGRAFLGEHGRRSRAREIRPLLRSLKHLEGELAALRSDPWPPAAALEIAAIADRIAALAPASACDFPAPTTAAERADELAAVERELRVLSDVLARIAPVASAPAAEADIFPDDAGEARTWPAVIEDDLPLAFPGCDEAPQPAR
ncbi:hypothetical protein [Propylenella binzhouense]|uniref:Uncharacterized protein n=1 Tax=Propylenella binzhouense TaxID=2555902 RepID=A0A964T3F4_9HYPH|nr:hypothetical protein [Propylenella binzhouense]MYZ47761.1 hypothetical protein [Propylenella binzhouense]